MYDDDDVLFCGCDRIDERVTVVPWIEVVPVTSVALHCDIAMPDVNNPLFPMPQI